MKRELKDKETIKYLEDIFSHRGYIYNPTRLDVPGFGKVIATSMALEHIHGEKIIPYFTFEMKRKSEEWSGEFYRENEKYFVKIETNKGVLQQ